MDKFKLKPQLTIRGSIGDKQIKIIPIHSKRFMVVEYTYENTKFNYFDMDVIGIGLYLDKILKDPEVNFDIHDIDLRKFLNNSTTNTVDERDKSTEQA